MFLVFEIHFSLKMAIWSSFGHRKAIFYGLDSNSKNKIFGNEIPCILDFSHFEPVEAWIWFPEVMTSKFFEHDNLTSKTYPFPKNTHINRNSLVQGTFSFNLNHTVHFRSRSVGRQIQRHVRVTVTSMSGISVTWAQDQILSC